jgi:predicted dehydrogenase
VDVDAFDAAVVAVPHDVAQGVVEQLLDAGRPVLMEKPLATTASTGRELCERASAVEAPSFVGYNYRFLEPIAALGEAVAAGTLGPLRNIDMLLGHGGHPASAEGWKLRPERAGGGVLLDPGVHLLDLLLRLRPGIECQHVAATRGFWGTGIEEDVVATFRDEDLLATVRISHIRWVNTFRIEVGGDDGYAIVEGRGGNYGDQTLRLGRRWAWRDTGAAQRETEATQAFGATDPSFERELEAVARSWLGVSLNGLERPATFAEALAVTELCERMYGMLDD